MKQPSMNERKEIIMLTEAENLRVIYVTTEIVCDGLSDLELVSLSLFCRLGQTAPEQRAFWPKASALFTQDGGKKIHEDSVKAIHDIAARRINRIGGKQEANNA